MRAAVLVFPGSNCDRDMAVALRRAGARVDMVWHKYAALPAGTDLVAIPGGFSFGDHLRCGAIAARAPIMGAVRAHLDRGGYGLGVCNGFQVLCEAGLLPGAMTRNAGLTFLCRDVELTVTDTGTPFTARMVARATLPVAHHDGAWIAAPATLAELEAAGRVAFRYAGPINGAMGDVAGVLSANGRVLGMMPHPERAVDPAVGGTDGAGLFAGLTGALVIA
ncbi:MAG: phosphoribosylformylglycinamidine synthase subunit PurQ [Paracoccaceae bacterium]